jgi:hypothetical protein
MLAGGHELLQERHLFTLSAGFDHSSQEIDVMLLRFLRFAIFLWTFYFALGWLWSMRQWNSSNGDAVAKTEGPHSTTRPPHPLASEEKPPANDEEQQREVELAEIAPDWLCWPILGLFAAGWIVIGLLWNLRWPGLIVAIGVMTAITYYVLQLQLRYLPTLRQELAREPRWWRSISLGSALLMFVLGVLCVVWLQATLGDLLSNVQILGGRRGVGYHVMSEKQLAFYTEAAKFESLGDADAGLHSAGFGYKATVPILLLSGLWGVCLLFFSVASVIHTRRYRYTWKYWWQPSIANTFYLLGALIVVHVLHLFTVGHADSRTDVRQIRVAADWDAVDAALETWKRQNGYVQPSFEDWKVKKGGVEIGALHARHWKPDSWFDRYQSSWRHMVVRPRPDLSLTIVSQHEPPQSFVEVRLPHATMGSPEKELWYALVNDLEESLGSAAPERENDRSKLVAAAKNGEQTSEANGASNGLGNDATSD